jgi:hypothetical protein
MRHDDKVEISRPAALLLKLLFKPSALKWEVGVDEDMAAVGLDQIAVGSVYSVIGQIAWAKTALFRPE